MDEILPAGVVLPPCESSVVTTPTTQQMWDLRTAAMKLTADLTGLVQSTGAGQRPDGGWVARLAGVTLAAREIGADAETLWRDAGGDR